MNKEDFFIGWSDNTPAKSKSQTRLFCIISLLLIIILAVLLPMTQKTIAISNYQWGIINKFSGVLQLHPYPHLLFPVAKDGTEFPQQANKTAWYLVGELKFGLSENELSQLDGKEVVVGGSLIFRDEQVMLETSPQQIQLLENSTKKVNLPKWTKLGNFTLQGEIVDSKCFLGVMNPGNYIPHRGCATRCISGGIPPMFIVRQDDGKLRYLLLVSPEGEKINQEILDKIAVPLEISGEVEQLGDLLMMRADPAKFKLL